jgi:hypothetical protein
MLFVLLNLRPIVEKYYQNYEKELELDLLSYQDWKKLYTIKEFLSPFLQATFAIEGDSISIDTILFIIDILIKHLQEITVSLFLFLSLSPFFLLFT